MFDVRLVEFIEWNSSSLSRAETIVSRWTIELRRGLLIFVLFDGEMLFIFQFPFPSSIVVRRLRRRTNRSFISLFLAFRDSLSNEKRHFVFISSSVSFSGSRWMSFRVQKEKQEEEPKFCLSSVYFCLCPLNPYWKEYSIDWSVFVRKNISFLSVNWRDLCFLSNDTLHRCCECLFSVAGLCLQGNRHRPKDFLCVVRSCHWAEKCELQSFVFCRPWIISCYSSQFFQGVDPSLLWITLINPLSIVLLFARLVYLRLNIIGRSSLLSSSIGVLHWLTSLISIERLCTAVFLHRRWLKKSRIVRRLIVLIIFCISIIDL